MSSHKTREDKLSKGNAEELPYVDEFDGKLSESIWKESLDLLDESEGTCGVIFQCARSDSDVVHEPPESRMLTLKGIMEALTDPNIYMVGVHGEDDSRMNHLLERVKRRARIDDLFGVIVTVNIRKRPNLRRIQEEIAHQLGFSFQGRGQEEKTAFCVFPNRVKEVVFENARQLSDRIRREPNILFILRDLGARLDLAKLGIPFGADHQACKLILTSPSEEILSNQMNVQRTFSVRSLP